MRRWLSTSHSTVDFCHLLVESCVSGAIVCALTKSQGETSQSSTAFAGLSTTTLDRHFPRSRGHLKNEILICGCGQRRQNLLHLLSPSFAFCLCIEGGFSSERAQVFQTSAEIFLGYTPGLCQSAVITVSSL